MAEGRRNALSIKMRDEITQQLDDWATDPAVRVVVLTGAGPTFCAGFDLGEFGQPDLARRIKDSSRRYHLAVWHFPKPLVAAVNGPAMGGGMDFSVLCDCRIASSAAAFGHPEIKFGAAPLFTPLQWIVGLGNARELCLTANANRRRRGVAHRTRHPRDRTRRTARRRHGVGPFDHRGAQVALEAAKRYLISSASATFEEAFAIEHDKVFDEFLIGPAG